MKISGPTLLLDEQKCKANISRMADKARKNELKFRPHFKTHQSRKVGAWFREAGVDAITVSSLGMAEYFAEDKWMEITVAFPANILQIDVINKLAGAIDLNLLVDNEEIVTLLAERLTHPVGIYIEIDTGGGRTGISYNSLEEIMSVAGAVDAVSKLRLKGFYTHAGHSYQSKSRTDIMQVFDQTIKNFTTVRNGVGNRLTVLEFCMGDTPTCSIATEFHGVDAISAGNFVFYDVMQTAIGSCGHENIAVAMACPVVSKNEITGEVCIYGGAVHFSKDHIEEDDHHLFGRVVDLGSQGWSAPLEGCYVKSLSQEHGIVKLSEEQFEKVKIGDVLGILPVHSCLTAEAMGYYLHLGGDYIDHYAQKNRDSPVS